LAAECSFRAESWSGASKLSRESARITLAKATVRSLAGSGRSVLNLPYRGNQSLFSDLGLKDNCQLYPFLEEQGFEIEHKAFPKRPRNETDESEELIVLVARKMQAQT